MHITNQLPVITNTLQNDTYEMKTAAPVNSNLQKSLPERNFLDSIYNTSISDTYITSNEETSKNHTINAESLLSTIIRSKFNFDKLIAARDDIEIHGTTLRLIKKRYFDEELVIKSDQELKLFEGINTLDCHVRINGPISDLTPLRFLKKVNGNLHIQGLTCDTLQGLYSLQKITGGLFISHCNSLSDLKGLTALSDVNQCVDLRYNNNLENLNGIQNLSQTKTLQLLHLPNLTDISACKSISSLKDLSLQDLANILHVQGLENIRSLRRLEIINCAQLQSLAAFNQCSSIENMNLDSLPALQNLNGFQSLLMVNHLYLRNLPQLTDISALSNLAEIRFSISLINLTKLQKFEVFKQINPPAKYNIHTKILDCPKLRLKEKHQLKKQLCLKSRKH